MKVKKIDRHVVSALNNEIAEEAKKTLEIDGVRMSLVYAFLFLTVSAGAGFLFSSLLLGLLDLFSVSVNGLLSYALTAIFIFLFAAPAFAGTRSLAASACDGDADTQALLVAFSSTERFFSSYLGAFTIFLRYTSAYLILNIPDLVFDHFDNSEGISPISFPIAFVATLIAFALWYLLTAKLGKLSYYIWSRRMPFFKALRESYKGHFISLGITGQNIFKAFLTAATLFILLIFHTGPLWVLEGEISMRHREEFIKNLNIEKSRKDGQDK